MFLRIFELQRVKGTAVCKFSFHAPLPGFAVLWPLLRDLFMKPAVGLPAPGVIKCCKTQQNVEADTQYFHLRRQEPTFQRQSQAALSSRKGHSGRCQETDNSWCAHTEMSPWGLFWAHALWWLMPDTFIAQLLFTRSCFRQRGLWLSARHARGVRWLRPYRQFRIKQWSQSTDLHWKKSLRPVFRVSTISKLPHSNSHVLAGDISFSQILLDLQCYRWNKVNSYLTQISILWQAGIWTAKFGLIWKQNISRVVLNLVQGSQGYNGTRRMVDLHAPSFLSIKSSIILMQISDPWQCGRWSAACWDLCKCSAHLAGSRQRLLLSHNSSINTPDHFFRKTLALLAN